MISEKDIKACVDMTAQTEVWEWNADTACTLAGIWNLYEAAGDTAYRDIVKAAMDQLTEAVNENGADGVNFAMAGCARFLFPLYREQAENSYQEAAEILWNWLQEQSWPDGAAADWAESFYLAEPFYLEYENLFHAKERYNHIQQQLKAASLLAAKSIEDQDEAAAGWYLAAMADCSSLISEEVFDHYKNAEGYLKAGLKQAAGMSSLLVVYAVLKGCRIGALLSEKYLDRAVAQLLESKHVLEDGTLTQKGFLLMAYGEYKKVCPEGEEQ